MTIPGLFPVSPPTVQIPENRHPTLMCQGVCAAPRPHEYEEKRADPDGVLSLVFLCKECGTRRVWGRTRP